MFLTLDESSRNPALPGGAGVRETCGATPGMAQARACRRGGLRYLALGAWLALVCPALLGQVLMASSQNPLKSMSLEQLGNIEVTTVSREPEEVWNTPAAVYVITQDAIRRSGATNIPEALRLAPGVEVARITADEYAIGIRGFNSRLSRYVLVLIDGRTVYTTLTAGTYWEVQDTFLDDVDRIEVIRGPGGTIWGPNAVNGVINIITKNAADTRGVMGDAAGGNVEQEFGGVRYGWGNGRGFAYRAYVKGFGWAPEDHADGDNYDDWHSGQGGFRMDWNRHQRDSLRLQGDVYGQDFGERVAAATYNPPANYDLSGDASLYGGNIVWNWRRVQGQGRDFDVEAYYAHDTREELNFGDLRNTVDVDFTDRLPLPRQEITWGGTLRASHGNETELYSGLTFTPPRRTDELYQGFVQDEITVTPNRLALTAGTKVLKTNYTGALGEPDVRLLYTPTSTETLWAAYTHAVRTPADVERDFNLSSFLGYSSGLPIFARFSANPHFRAEQLNGYELGYRAAAGSNFYVSVASFYSHYGDSFSEDLVSAPYIETSPAPTHILIPAQFGNGLVATTSGGEIAPEWQPTPWWRVGGWYSLLAMHVKKGTGSQDIGSAPAEQGSSPEHQAEIENGFDLPESVALDTYVRYVSALPGIQVGSYWTGDARVHWAATHHIGLTVAGRNLFQPEHVEFSYDPGPPVGIRRSFYGEITFSR